SVSGGTFSVNGSHAYAEEGSATITVTIHHALAPDADATSSAAISDSAVNATGGLTVQATEATSFNNQAVATFTDPSAEPLSDYSASIDWGDSSSSTGNISFDSGTGIFTVSGGHNYAEEGPYPVRVTIHHDMAPDITVT